ncbi:ATP-binding protein [Nocardia gamkensis]|uniref:ATP-binding protein n=1 Tax=Nocardia gamkensis TaxID=352869 RepID=A0A7X6L7F3_9NOCA|nr:ATP-binding protein [Nocardia gamkensis]NKY29190.1 ATP-binding protein [Nocardia gamkensis]
MSNGQSLSPEESIRTRMERESGVRIVDVQIRDYPGERNYVLYVQQEDLASVALHTAKLESELSTGDIQVFLIIRPAEQRMISESLKLLPAVDNVSDLRVTELVSLVSARSRVSAAEPSLVYVPDVRASLSSVTAARHHLIFGRRGSGKTALLVEARRRVESSGAITAWINIQTYRREAPQRVVLWTIQNILSSVAARHDALPPRSAPAVAISRVHSQTIELLDQSENSEQEVVLLIPKVQAALSRYLEVTNTAIYVFLDDFYYVSRDMQPIILDMLHGISRDIKLWLKVASIKHLTRWWISSPPTGMQTGQDAEVIDLDVTLQDPQQARQFLENVLAGYAKAVRISSLLHLFSRKALDRLVLASGAVPRDYMVLAASAITRAQQRVGARQVGAQEVNQAAGDAAAAKIKELEEDMASNPGSAARTIETLKIVRSFCLEESGYTYFLVGFRDKEDNPIWYSLLTDLMDVRLIHLVDPGVSDPHSAGHRSEAYMLDLSQYSGARLKQGIRMLDFEGGRFVSRQTRSPEPTRVAHNSRQLIAILRSAPRLPLERLEPTSSPAKP